MELGVVRLLAAEARAAGLDPARDPIPGLRRDVLFTCTADEEAGRRRRRQVDRRERPDWLRAAGRGQRERWGVGRRWPAGASIRSRSRRRGSPPTGSACAGTWGHGSMPRDRQRGRPGRGDRRTPRRAGTDPPDAGHGAVPPGRWPRSCRARPRHGPRDRRRRCRRPRRRLDARLRPDVRPGPARAPPRHPQPGRHPRRGQVQRHPGRRDHRGRLPGPARHDRAGRREPRSSDGSDRTSPPACEIELHRLGRARRVAGGGTALGRPGRDAIRDSRPGGHPAAGHGARSPPTPRAPSRSGSRRTASRRSGSTRTSGFSSASTASTSASRSTRCAGGCRSSTTWFAASAADPSAGRSSRAPSGRRRSTGFRTTTCSSQRRADVQLRAARPRRAPGRDRSRRGAAAAARAGSSCRRNGDAPGGATPR